MNEADLNDFLSILMNGNKINARRLRREYFLKVGKVDLFDGFVNATNHSDKPIREKVNLAILGYLTEYPKCKVCGKESIIQGKTISPYCSRSCALNDPERARKISDSKRKSDNTESNEKRKRTMIERYGVAYNSQRKDIHDRWTKTKLSENVYSKLSDKEWLETEYLREGKTALEIGKDLGCDFSTVLCYCRSYGFPIRQHYNQSQIEREVYDWLKGLGINVIQSYVGAYNDKRELDLFIPSKNLGIEINGLYWHTEQFRDKYYHQKKKNEIREGVRLIQITDKQWKEKREICESIVLNALGLSKRIGARKCKVETYQHTTDEITAFFDHSHMDGFVGGSTYIVLRYEGEIVAGVIFGRSRFHKEKRTEILRYVCKNGTQIQGAFNRIIKEYRKTNGEPLFSYVNLSLFDATLYRVNPNWSFKGYTGLGYLWTNGNEVISRYKAMPKRLKEWLPNYTEGKGEVGNMQSNGYYRYFDCGNAVYEYVEALI